MYDDTLNVTEAEPLLSYIVSFDESGKLEGYAREVQALEFFLEKEISDKGSFRISKSTGMFVAVKAT